VNAILTWLLTFLLDYLLKRASAAVVETRQQVKEDERLEKIDHANIEAYEKAKTREERIGRAVALLNSDSALP